VFGLGRVNGNARFLIKTEKEVAYYKIKFEGKAYVNADLYMKAVSMGKAEFMRRLASGALKSVRVLDHYVYSLADESLIAPFNYEEQDFDEDYMSLHPYHGNGSAEEIHVKPLAKPFRYRRYSFLRMTDFSESRKYALLPNLPAIKVCGAWYVALEAVRQDAEKPIAVIPE
jgi:hypothetical protein